MGLGRQALPLGHPAHTWASCLRQIGQAGGRAGLLSPLLLPTIAPQAPRDVGRRLSSRSRGRSLPLLMHSAAARGLASRCFSTRRPLIIPSA